MEDSHLGVDRAESVILNVKYWESTPGFPKTAFCRQEARIPELEGNLYHTKFIVAGELASTFPSKTEEPSLNVTDDTVLYFGSHNFSAGAWGNQEKSNS